MFGWGFFCVFFWVFFPFLRKKDILLYLLLGMFGSKQFSWLVLPHFHFLHLPDWFKKCIFMCVILHYLCLFGLHWTLFSLLLSCLFCFLFGFMQVVSYIWFKPERKWEYSRLFILGWWFDPGCMPGNYQSPSIISPKQTVEDKYNERLMSWNKERDRFLIDYYQRQNRLVLGKLIEFVINQNQSRLMKSKTIF